MSTNQLNEQELFRRQSLEQMRALGINPYPAEEYLVNAYSTEIRDNFNEEERRDVSVAGRIMS